MIKSVNLSEYSDEELVEINKQVSLWKWDKRLGKKPFLFEKLNNYRKPHNAKYRLELLFRAIWPFTKEKYLTPFLEEVHRRKLL